MKVYIAGPLFNELELKRNLEIRDIIQELGFETYLPQVDGGISYNVINEGNEVDDTRAKIFRYDVEQIKQCDILLCLLDGRVSDEGMCVELGIAYAMQKICIGYMTDQRSLDKYGISLMIEGTLISISRSIKDLRSQLIEIRE